MAEPDPDPEGGAPATLADRQLVVHVAAHDLTDEDDGATAGAVAAVVAALVDADLPEPAVRWAFGRTCDVVTARPDSPEACARVLTALGRIDPADAAVEATFDV